MVHGHIFCGMSLSFERIVRHNNAVFVQLPQCYCEQLKKFERPPEVNEQLVTPRGNFITTSVELMPGTFAFFPKTSLTTDNSYPISKGDFIYCYLLS